jgi:hypothetical protein
MAGRSKTRLGCHLDYWQGRLPQQNVCAVEPHAHVVRVDGRSQMVGE